MSLPQPGPPQAGPPQPGLPAVPSVGPVLVVGAGLIGTSVALALTRRRIPTRVSDVDPMHEAVATSRLRDGGPAAGDEARLVVVATPPDQLGATVVAALWDHPAAVVTDVGSVKQRPLDDVRSLAGGGGAGGPSGGGSAPLARYVGGHPMAGSERSGPLAAAADLFDGRTWAVTPHDESAPASVAAVEALASACGAVVVRMRPDEHDEAVARTSHLPHLMAALTAGRLYGASAGQLALSGQGVRDVTRIAAGSPQLWRQIVGANAVALRDLLSDVRRDVDDLLSALDTGRLDVLERILTSGATAAATIPGRHGGPTEHLVAVTVTVPDRPGALAGLFEEVGALGVNIEDVRIDHDPAREFGLVEIDVAAAAGADLAEALRARGWAAHR